MTSEAMRAAGRAAFLSRFAKTFEACATNESDRWDAKRMEECANDSRLVARLLAIAKHPQTSDASLASALRSARESIAL